MNKIYICEERTCLVQEYHENHHCYPQEAIDNLFFSLSQSKFVMDYNFLISQFSLLSELFDKIKGLLERKMANEKLELESAYQNYGQSNPDWKLLAQTVVKRQHEVCLKLICPEILRRVEALIEIFQNVHNSERSQTQSKCPLKFRINNKVASTQIEEEIPKVEVRAKLKQTHFVGNHSEKMIKNISLMSNNQFLIHFDSNSLINYNGISKCSMQETITCISYHFQYPLLVVENNYNNFSLYQFNTDSRKLQLVTEILQFSAEWFQLYENNIVLQQLDHHFYSYSLTNSMQRKLLEVQSLTSTINLLVNTNLVIIQNNLMKIYDLQKKEQSSSIRLACSTNYAKSQCNNQIVCMSDEKLIFVDLIKKQVVKQVQFNWKGTTIYTNPDVPYMLLIIQASTNLKESRVCFYDTKQVLLDLSNQYPTAIYIDGNNLLIGDDLGYIQIYELKFQ